MASADERNDEEGGIGHALWSNRNRILASTAALGFAAFAAGSLVPPVQQATVRLSAPPEVSAHWDDATLQRVISEAPRRPEPSRSTVLSAWLELLDQTEGGRAETGAERRPDGSVEVWARDREAEVARAHAEALAEQLIADLDPVVADVSTPAGEAAPPPETSQRNSAIEALDASIASARETLASAEDRQAALPPPRPSDQAKTSSRSSQDAANRNAPSLRRELEGLVRFARSLPSATPSDAPASLRESEEWRSWRNARVRRDTVATQITELSRTLLDGHPRMATLRLRLDDLNSELDEARDRLATAIQRRIGGLRRDLANTEQAIAQDAAASKADQQATAARAEVEAEVAAARQTLDALLSARAAAVAATSAAPTPEPVVPPVVNQPAVPQQKPAVSMDVTVRELRPNIWPIVAGSAAFGFIAASLLAIFASPRGVFAPAAFPQNAPARTRRGATASAGSAAIPHPQALGIDITPADELIAGILASEVSRVVIVPVAEDERPVAVEIVRRLSLRGSQAALLDLSERQLAARAMGVEDGSLGVSDMIAGEATFAEIARRDVPTQAEVFGRGQAVIGEAAFLAMERRNVLDFIERNFEVLLVVCGGVAPETVKSLLTPDAALVVTVDGEDEAIVTAGIRRLREAGLSDMILANGRQFAL
ncbi:hypothetical protein ACLNGM_16815 [Aureimonas phyllosphaerae]|uniref:hypothetical protein n=1 Tax=Aureimonas phyllosphaerae TaxID=1166078 RepID=UPI003A5C74CF